MAEGNTASQGVRLPGEEEDVEPEFQVAPMVDVLLVLLLFFMATATTDIVAQVANLVLPDASDAKEAPTERPKQLVVNIEKVTRKIKINSVFYDSPKDVIPVIIAAREAAVISGTRPEDFRVLIRADVDTPFGVVSDVLEAAATGAKIPNVTFAVNLKKGAHGESTNEE